MAQWTTPIFIADSIFLLGFHTLVFLLEQLNVYQIVFAAIFTLVAVAPQKATIDWGVSDVMNGASAVRLPRETSHIIF